MLLLVKKILSCICVMCSPATCDQAVKENPSLLLSHSDSKQRSHVSDTADDRRDQKKKKGVGMSFQCRE